MPVFSPRFEITELRTVVPREITKDAVLRKLHDVAFMVSLSPIASFKGPAAHPSAWIVAAAEQTHAETPSAIGPATYSTMDEGSPLGAWAPRLEYTTASINYADGYKSVVEAPMGTRLWIDVSVAEEGGQLVLREKMHGMAPLGMTGFVQKTYTSSHKKMTQNMIERLEQESKDASRI